MSANHPAFPLASGRCDGLTKRELFAAMAMQGFLADRSNIQSLASDDPASWDKTLAEVCVFAADALIAQLEKTND